MPYLSRLDQVHPSPGLGVWNPTPPSQQNGFLGPDTELEDQWLSGSFAHGVRRIDYRLFVPAQADRSTAMPMLVMLHGCGQDAEDFAQGTRMNALARDAGVMVLYPEQVQRANAHNCWNWFKPMHQRRGRGEPELLACLVRLLTAEFHADASRIYIAGLSAGGAMAAILAQEYPELFAAVGVHSGVPPRAAKDLDSALETMRYGAQAVHCIASIPLILFHGEADDVVHRSNGAALVQAACEAFGLEDAPMVRTGRSSNCRSFTQRVFAQPGRIGMVEHWLLHGAGHAWSGGDAAGSCCALGGPDASAEMLRFFLSHRAGTVQALLN